MALDAMFLATSSGHYRRRRRNWEIGLDSEKNYPPQSGQPFSLRNYLNPSFSASLSFFTLSFSRSPRHTTNKNQSSKQMSSIVISLRFSLLPKANVIQVPSSLLCCFIMYNITFPFVEKCFQKTVLGVVLFM